MKPIHSRRLIQVVKDLQKTSDQRICFILGAGASVTSGIPSGGKLAREWLQEILEVEGEEGELWTQEHKITEENAPTHYPELFERRFRDSRQNGFEFLNQTMLNKKPSAGYAFLAEILASTRHNVVITTNFDSLTELALYQYTDKQPLVVGHESLAGFARANTQRPLISKIHGSLFLDMANEPDKTDKLAKSWQQALSALFHDRLVIVVGYGGNDGSLMSVLQNLTDYSQLFWCEMQGVDPNPEVIELLETQQGKWVSITGFDELMFDLQQALGLKFREQEIEGMHRNWLSVYRDAIEKLRDRNRNASAEGKHRAQQIANAVDLDTWWDYQLKADAETDADKAEIWYRKGLAKFPDSARLLGSYALFLNVNQREYDQAEAYYQKALAIDSEDEIFLGSYAFFLHEIRKDYNQAEEYYQKALAIDSENNIFLVSYAIFLHEIRREYDQAEEYYQKALKINPKHVISLVSYAIFLHQIRKKYDQAEAYFQKALAIDPDHANNLGNYAQLKLCQGKLEEGKKLMDQSFDKATEADTMLELWFYRAAHFPEYYEEGLQELEERVANGDRSPAWDFSCQLKAAEENSHPYLERLRELAETITSVEE